MDNHVWLANLSNYDMLIGMDIISLGDFAIHNYGGKTVMTFTYPPEPYEEE